MSVKEIYVPSENPKNTGFHEVEVLTGQKFIRAYSPFIGDNGNWFIYDDQKKIYVDTNVKAQGTVHFASFKIVNGRLKMYSEPEIDKVKFIRVGSRLKYRLHF